MRTHRPSEAPLIDFDNDRGTLSGRGLDHRGAAEQLSHSEIPINRAARVGGGIGGLLVTLRTIR